MVFVVMNCSDEPVPFLGGGRMDASGTKMNEKIGVPVDGQSYVPRLNYRSAGKYPALLAARNAGCILGHPALSLDLEIDRPARK